MKHKITISVDDEILRPYLDKTLKDGAVMDKNKAFFAFLDYYKSEFVPFYEIEYEVVEDDI